jgi:hypothetical protein
MGKPRRHHKEHKETQGLITAKYAKYAEAHREDFFSGLPRVQRLPWFPAFLIPQRTASIEEFVQMAGRKFSKKTEILSMTVQSDTDAELVELTPPLSVSISVHLWSSV